MHVLSVCFNDSVLTALRLNGFATEVVNDDELELTDWVNDHSNYDAVIVNLDKVGGLYMCRGLRKANNHTPVFGVMSERDSNPWTNLRAAFLENGGDDLMRAPANPRELIASMKATLRRMNNAPMLKDTKSTLLFDDGTVLELDPHGGRVRINDTVVHLTNSERDVLMIMAGSIGKVFSKEAILNRLYAHLASDRDAPEIKIIDVFICKLRRKLNNAVPNFGNVYLQTIWGRGYCISLTADKTRQCA